MTTSAASTATPNGAHMREDLNGIGASPYRPLHERVSSGAAWNLLGPSGRTCGAAYFCIDVVQHETSADSSVMSMMRRLANENATPVVHVDVVSPGIIEPSMVDRRLIRTPDHAGARKASTASLLAATAQSLRPRLAAGGTGGHG